MKRITRAGGWANSPTRARSTSPGRRSPRRSPTRNNDGLPDPHFEARGREEVIERDERRRVLSLEDLKDHMASATTRNARWLIVEFDPNDRNIDAREWIEDYNDAATAIGWSSSIKKEWFPVYLKGSAKLWFRFLKRRRLSSEDIVNRNIHELPYSELTWREIERLFCEHYSSDYDHRAHLERLFREPQKPAEDYREYIDVKLNAGSSLGKSISEIIRSIEMHLLPEISVQLGATEFFTLEALERAIKRAKLKLDMQREDKAKLAN